MNNIQKPLTYFIITLSIFILVGAILGGIGSFFTGHEQELPKYRGTEYLLFGAKLGIYAGIMFGLIPSIIVAYVKNKKLHKNNKKEV